MHSIVCSSMPFVISMTNMAISAKFPPLFLRLLNAACPGVSINNMPGIVKFIFIALRRLQQVFFIASKEILVEEIDWVIPQASPFATFVFLILSKSVVLPWSIWPTTVKIGLLIMHQKRRN